MPTVLELAGVKPLAEWNEKPRPPLPGKSLVPLFKRDATITRDALYWQHEGNRALRVGDWKLVSEFGNNSQWELYDLKRDRIESRNLAESNPRKVKELSATWTALDGEFHQQGRGADVTK